MSARKLGRFAGLVFVLAVVFGGGATVSTGEPEGYNAAAARMSYSSPSQASSLGLEWD